MHHNPIFVSNLSHTYPDGTRSLNEVSFFVRPTERIALIGANGSGKSTLLKHLNGLLLPQVGSVQVGELPVIPSNLKAIRNLVGLLFQNPDDQLFMPTVYEDVAFGPMNQGLRGLALEERVTRALAAVDLIRERYAHRLTPNLSGGEKQRVAIAGVLAMHPHILLLDEPSAQLDPRSRRHLIHLCQSLSETQVIATHDLDLALSLCQRVVVLNQGKVVRSGPTLEVLSDEPFLAAHGLELPLSLSRPYCDLTDAPTVSPLFRSSLGSQI